MSTANVTTRKPERLWILWTALVIAGVLLLAEAFQIGHLTKWTARLGIGLVYTALALIVAYGRWPAIVGVVVVWLAIILCYLL
ncbi:MAG: hypothetical protein ABIE70_07310 [bacterium]